MTTKNKTVTDAEIESYRATAEMYRDGGAVALCSAALAGDTAARAKVASLITPAQPKRTRAPRCNAWAVPAPRASHPFAHDEE